MICVGARDRAPLGDEIDALARRRGAGVHWVAPDDGLTAERLRALVPDIAARDVFVAGPTPMVEAARAGLRAAGVPPPARLERGVRLMDAGDLARRAAPLAIATAGVAVVLHSVRARPEPLPPDSSIPKIEAGPTTKTIHGVSTPPAGREGPRAVGSQRRVHDAVLVHPGPRDVHRAASSRASRPSR